MIMYKPPDSATAFLMALSVSFLHMVAHLGSVGFSQFSSAGVNTAGLVVFFSTLSTSYVAIKLGKMYPSY